MMTLENIKPDQVAKGLKSGELVLIDIREPDEYAREHIGSALSLPLSALESGSLTLQSHQKAVFHCKSGMRTQANCNRLVAHVTGEAFLLEGGLDAWKADGLPTVTDKSAPLELNRQVQITAGALILMGVLLGIFVNAGFLGISGFVGAGLMFAGITGWCGMAQLLANMPWNRVNHTVSS